MTDLKKDMARIQTLVGDAFSTTGGLVALSDGGVMSEQKLQQTLEQTAAKFEKAALELRTLCEKHSPGKGGYGKRPPAPFCAIDGHVEKLGYSWLHIQLNTLLPHCRYQTPLWLTDTLRRLLDNFEWQKGFAMQFGLIAVDRAHGQTRAPKPSLAFLGRYAAKA